MMDIRGNTVLPAERKPVTLHTADGLELVGELALPVTNAPVATCICLHPLPGGGGMMDSHLLKKMANRLPALADLAILRFNTRGTTSTHGTSQGSFGDGITERYDVAAALDLAEAENLPNLWLVGWSFGTDLALMHGCDPSIVGAILLSPPLRFSTQEHLEGWTKPLVVLVPELDDYLRPDEAKNRFTAVPQAKVIAVERAKHLWVGFAERVLDEIVRTVNPAAYPLPRTYEETA